MAELTATTSVLHIDTPSSKHDLHALFQQRDEETNAITRSLLVDRRTWRDLGYPEVVTVTVEPGDRLNGD